jgi:hypothetical protein
VILDIGEVFPYKLAGRQWALKTRGDHDILEVIGPGGAADIVLNGIL